VPRARQTAHRPALSESPSNRRIVIARQLPCAGTARRHIAPSFRGCPRARNNALAATVRLRTYARCVAVIDASRCRNREREREREREICISEAISRLGHPSCLVTARMLMRAFAPAHYAWPGPFSRRRHFSRKLQPRGEAAGEGGGAQPAARPARRDVRRNRTRHLVASRGQPVRSSLSLSLSLSLSFLSAWTSCGQRPGQALVVKVILHARARDR